MVKILVGAKDAVQRYHVTVLVKESIRSLKRASLILTNSKGSFRDEKTLLSNMKITAQ